MRRIPGNARRSVWFLALVVLAVLASVTGAAAQDGGEAVPAGVRGADDSAKSLLVNGMARSRTFRSIVDEIEHSNVIVYVEVRSQALPGQLQLVASSGGCRFVRVSIRKPALPADQVAWLAHELWHAVEIARAPEVREALSLRKLYERIGGAERYGDNAESGAAQDVWTRVLAELRDAK
jgi:hypothetical protein